MRLYGTSNCCNGLMTNCEITLPSAIIENLLQICLRGYCLSNQEILSFVASEGLAVKKEN